MDGHDLVRMEGGVTIPHTLDEAMGRLRKKWRKAPRGSQEWRNLIFYEQALRVLEVAVSD